MHASPVAHRYTQALLDDARGQVVLDAVHGDFAGLRDLLASSEAFAGFVADPTIPDERRDAALTALLDGKVNALTLDFLRLLSRKRRLAILPGILTAFQAQVDAERGEVEAEIVSAGPLSDDQVNKLCAKLEQRGGKTIRPRVRVDASLLGGFRVRMGDVIEDFSLATKLETFKRNVINA
jgi:F-type H+-transporting ATPase subunit delta